MSDKATQYQDLRWETTLWITRKPAKIGFQEILRHVDRSVLGFTAAAVVIAVVIAGPWALDIWKDRKHTLLVKSETPIFAGEGDESCGGMQLTTVQAGTTLRVQRIRYWKNCATLNVVLSDGREGYAVYDSSMQVRPPLD